MFQAVLQTPQSGTLSRMSVCLSQGRGQILCAWFQLNHARFLLTRKRLKKLSQLIFQQSWAFLPRVLDISELEVMSLFDDEDGAVHPGRLVESGVVPTSKAQEFAMVFESFPIWLLTLEKVYCKRLHLLGFLSAGDFRGKCEALGIQMKLVHREFKWYR
jgi:hypothetical protein